jgi:SAM-dependent methyltransferase
MKVNCESTAEETRRLWDREYGETKVIPSSIRPLPSKALVLYEGLVDFSQLSPVLDAGCGNGRNAIYMASKGCTVHAIDSSAVALEFLRQRASGAGLLDRIEVHNQFLGDAWPFSDDRFGFVLDSYVFCHYLERSSQETYREELRRVLRPGGLLYSSVFCVDDAYYAEMLPSSSGNRRIVRDPRNGIQKFLYTEDEFRKFFSECFRIRYYTKFQFDDIVLGRVYRRSILTLLLEK